MYTYGPEQPDLEIIQEQSGQFGVYGKLPGSRAARLTVFETQAEAAAWIYGYQLRNRSKLTGGLG
jgi:hypothetical protein